jgi:ribonuclease Y
MSLLAQNLLDYMNADTIITFALGLLLGVGLFMILSQRQTRLMKRNLKKDAEISIKEKSLVLNEKLAKQALEIQGKESELEQKIQVSNRLKKELEEKEKNVSTQEGELIKEQKSLDEAKYTAKKLERFYRLKLHQITQMSQKEARELLLQATEKDCEAEIQSIRREKLGRSESEINDEARKLLLASMQRLSSQAMNDATATLVQIPNEEFKGRIIGKEGRNIRTFEHATGTTLMMDESPDSVLVSSFDPVRREIARISLEALVRDGRIHPANIEETVKSSEDAIYSSMVEVAEKAVLQLRLNEVSHDVLTTLGHLNYRLSNNQNTLEHSIEVSNFCALLAAELGYDVDLAKRAGLYHDIGKALSEEGHESHAIAGANFMKKHGEDDLVVNAIAAHHKEVEPESVYASLVMIADSISATRPGVRTSSVDGFYQRVKTIELIAKEQQGVDEAYAIQAGKELRVIVKPEVVDDAGCRQIARRIRSRIENELSYPGVIEITVIREQRFNETAV